MAPESFYDIAVTGIDGEAHTMARYRGQVLLIVNVASRCGYTPQYAGLERLHRRFRDDGVAVLGFPCDQFGGQEPGAEPEIQRFCVETFDVTFPLFQKVRVNGPDAHPLFVFLKSRRKGILGSANIKWNFTKFLVDRSGDVIARYAPQRTPESIGIDIAAAAGSSAASAANASR